jgi:phosphoglycolate phosphatase
MARVPGSAVIFDLDGVIVDSRPAIVPCINHALAVHGFAERSEQELHRFIGPRIATAFAELTASPVGSPVVEACVATFRERYAAASLRDTSVTAGIPEVLRELGGTHRLAVATSNPLAFTEPLLSMLALRDLFAVVAGPELRSHAEDKATTIGVALDRLGTRHAVVVGDRLHDVAGAHAHGLPAIGVTWGIGSRAELQDAGADAIVDAPAELPGVCGGLLGRAMS